VWGLDISARALRQATQNAANLGLANVTFRKSDMFSALPAELKGGIDVVTIHPPYVAKGDVAGLPDEIKRYEPRHTLTDGSSDGLGLARRVMEEGPLWLRPGGWLLIEIMPSESGRIRKMLRAAGFREIRSTHGEHRQTRVIVGRR
jgi:release factor glutamine methyltransferase